MWTACQVLGADRYFAFSDWVPNSFDSRYFGPVDADEITGVYRPLFVAANLTR
ncbi:MAG: S26 family signal peptidase [Nitrospirota bacterium]|nr:S26 family signal peptidase [Nitrospirota bacterium]